MKTNRWKQVIRIAWPLIIANGFWNLQLTIDRIYLGLLSTESLGAALAVMGVFWVPMALLQGTSAYVTSFIAQYFGADETEKIGEVTWQAIYVALIGGLAFLFLNRLSPWFFSLIGHSPNMQHLEVEYFNSVAYSALPTALVAVANGFFTGLGQTKKIIGINMVGLTLNALLDYLMIFGRFGFPAMGIAGAGYATAIAACGAALYGFYLIWKSDQHLKFQARASMHLNLTLLKKFLKFGLPSGMQWALEGLAFTVFLIIMGQLPNGEAALASSSITMTVMMLSVLPCMGVAQAVMSLVGQNLGDKHPEEAEAFAWAGVRVSLVYMTLIAFTFFAVPEFYLSWFTNHENPGLWMEVKSITPSLLKIMAFFTLLDSMYLNISLALKGAGDTRFVSIVAFIVPWPLMVLPAYLVKSWNNAVIWAWCFVALYSIIITAILVLRFKQGRWKTMSVIH